MSNRRYNRPWGYQSQLLWCARGVSGNEAVAVCASNRTNKDESHALSRSVIGTSTVTLTYLNSLG